MFTSWPGQLTAHEPPPLRTGYSASRRLLLPFLRGCSMTASGPGNIRLVWPLSKCTRYGGSPPAPRTSTISPIRSEWPTMLPPTCNRSPTAAASAHLLTRVPMRPVQLRTGSRYARCHDKCQVSVSMPLARPSTQRLGPSTVSAAAAPETPWTGSDVHICPCRTCAGCHGSGII